MEFRRHWSLKCCLYLGCFVNVLSRVIMGHQIEFLSMKENQHCRLGKMDKGERRQKGKDITSGGFLVRNR